MPGLLVPGPLVPGPLVPGPLVPGREDCEAALAFGLGPDPSPALCSISCARLRLTGTFAGGYLKNDRDNGVGT